MTDTPAPCCLVGARPDVDAINAAYANGGTVREVHALFPDVSRASIGRHRVCLKRLGDISGDEHETRGVNRDSRRAPMRPALPPANETAAGDNGRRSNVLPFRRTVRLSEAAGLASQEAHVAFLARLIEGDRFRFRPTLEWLAAAWGIPDHEVRDRYRLAVQRVSADKQVECAEKEVNLAALETKEAAAMKEFRRLRVSEPTTAKGYLQLATKCRMEYATLAGLRRTQVDVNVNIWQRPEFVMAVDAVVETSLDALIPQAEAEFQAMVREVEAKLGMAVDPKVAAAVLEIASGRMQEKLGAQVRQGAANEPAAAE